MSPLVADTTIAIDRNVANDLRQIRAQIQAESEHRLRMTDIVRILIRTYQEKEKGQCQDK
jgi:hypothetical protein